MSTHRFPAALKLLWLLSVLLASAEAHAVPAYARQTGENCIACHINFPELTPFGRYFKLSGYTLGKKAALPLSAMLQLGMTKTRNTTNGTPDGVSPSLDPGAPPVVTDGRIIPQQLSLFVAGKLTDNIGIFNQWTATDDSQHRHTSIDNTDIRYADRVWAQDVDFMYGFSLHNNPTMQDVWNTTPVWGYPYASSGTAVGPVAGTILEGGLSGVAGMGAYFFWNKTLYAELTAYRNSDQILSVLRAGQDATGYTKLNGYNPYWRLALNHEAGAHSFMVGTFGMVANVYPNNTDPTGPTDKFKDIGLDAQYQYITDPHTFTLLLTSIREKANWNASGPSAGGAGADNDASTLKSRKAKATYQYDRKYGITLGYFSTTGDVDFAHWGTANGSPDTKGGILELHYLPRQDIKLSAIYTHYTKFNGASTSYDNPDGVSGRNASDNDSLFLLGWFMF